MAQDKGQRTEKPTPRHRQRARAEGRVARSSEIGSWFSLAALLFALPWLGSRAIGAVTGFMATATNAMGADDPGTALALVGRGLSTVLVAAGPLVVVATGAALLASYAQVGFRFAPGALGFKWNKVAPTTGIKRVFSASGAWEITKMALRLVLLAVIGYLGVRHLVQGLLGSGTLPIAATLSAAGGGLLAIARDVAGLALVLAFADYAFQRHRFNETMKMTREEVRRELRETDGSPEMRRALRRRRRRLSRMQVLAAVAQANVIVVNPTHFAVGLRYERARDAAPRVVAKGEDEDALAIRAAAIEAGVPVVENPPVARALCDSCEIGDIVPPELYQVVARVLAFVYRLSPTARALVDVHKMAS